MTIKMRLDTEGLRALIKDNPELQVEIDRAVLNNIKADAIHGAVEGQIRACMSGMIVKDGPYYNQRVIAKDPLLIKLVTETTQQLVVDVVNSIVLEKIEATVVATIEAERKKLGTELKAILKTLVTPEMARDIVREKIL